MSRSNPTAKNPAVRFMQWRGGFDGGGQLSYYDKEKQENVEVARPFVFIVLDELNTITGFSEKDQSSFWSNEVRDMRKDELFVRTKGGLVDSGLYQHISERIKAKGAKYAKSVYVAFKDEEGEFQIGNIRFSGAALTAWIEFQKKFDVYKCAVILTEDAKAGKKGATKYYIPIFDAMNVSDASDKEAKVLDQQLQGYLSTYFSQQQDISTEVVAEDFEEDEPKDEPEEDDDADLVEETKKAEKPKDDKKLNLKDVPF